MTNPRALIGVTGGIAAYKTAALTSQLVQAGIQCQVIMTESAFQFIGDATFAALTGRPVASKIFEPNRFPLGAHIELAREYSILCVAPASANFLAKSANGIADDLLSTLFLCFKGPKLFAPAMNCEMWESPAVQRNAKTLIDDGVQMIGPESGWLSCRVQGVGRMAEPPSIFDAVQSTLASIEPSSLT